MLDGYIELLLFLRCLEALFINRFDLVVVVLPDEEFSLDVATMLNVLLLLLVLVVLFSL